MTPDSNFDQQLRPRGSLFVELYNPWNTQTSTLNNGYPACRKRRANSTTSWARATGVQLNATSPSGNSPVWRLITAGLANAAYDPDDFLQLIPQFVKANVDRAVYFSNPAAISDLPGAMNYYTSYPVAPLLPGRYAVVGPTGQPGLNTPAGPNPTSFVNTVGRIQGGVAGSSAQTRQIVLTPNANPTINQVEVSEQQRSAPYTDPADADIQPRIAIVMNQAITAGVPYSYPELFVQR